METTANDRRKEYEFLRDEMGRADRSCQLLVATLAAITGAIILKWNHELWYAGLTLQVIWLFGIMYFAERRFTIARIARYIREHIEKEDNGFCYETVTFKLSQAKKKRPWSLPTPLYREVAMGAIVVLFVPLIGKQILSLKFSDIRIVISLFFGLGIAITGLKICQDYKQLRDQNGQANSQVTK